MWAPPTNDCGASVSTPLRMTYAGSTNSTSNISGAVNRCASRDGRTVVDFGNLSACEHRRPSKLARPLLPAVIFGQATATRRVWRVAGRGSYTCQVAPDAVTVAV